jgi:hypothetical protein
VSGTTKNMNSTKQLKKQKMVALTAIGQWKVYIFFAFSVELGEKTKFN